MKKTTAVLFLLAMIAGVHSVALAGNLEPPGPPASTGKSTIFQVDMPFTITSPGSYIVKEDLFQVGAVDGITINADDVTIDLNGFSLTGIGLNGNGIGPNLGAQRNITVKNGTITGWGSDGVGLSQSDSVRVLNITAVGNVGANSTGIRVGTRSTVSGCIANDNNQNGIIVFDGSTVSDCVANQNGGQGIFVNGAGASATIVNSTANRNSNGGIGLQDGGGIVSDCTTNDNLGNYGISVRSNALVTANEVHGNTAGRGIIASGSDTRVEGNNSTNNDTGFDVSGSGILVIKNSASGNTASNYSIGLGNSFGPIVNVAGVGDISGTADHPWTNFEY